MTGRRLSELLRGAEIPAERESEERSWEVIREAYAKRERLPARQRPLPRLALALGGGLALVALALSPAGAKVGDLVDDVVQIGEEDARPALTRLPAAGELLVESSQGPWVVTEDGSKRLLGDYEHATWSPNGLFVAVTADHEVTAVEPDGDVRWSIASDGRVSDPRWAPSGFRIAYRSGDDLRLVAGDGTGDRLVARDVAPIAPAWRPVLDAKLAPQPAGAGVHVLTYIDGSGRLRALDTDTGGFPERRRYPFAPPHVTGFEWSADGRRLLTLQEDAVVLQGRGYFSIETVAPGTYTTAALAPDGRTVAAVLSHPRRRGRPARSELQILSAQHEARSLLSNPGRFTDVAWSPDGRWILVAWRDADQWLFIRPDRPRRVVAIGDISDQFSPGATGEVTFPRIAGWVLPTR